MKNTTNLIRSPSQYNRHYHDMRGVDFTGDGSSIAADRFAYLENMYRDYDGEGAGITESIPGFRRLCSLGEPIYGIFSQNTSRGRFILVHAGYHLYRFSLESRDSLPSSLTPIGTLSPAQSAAFSHGSSVYILDGQNLHIVDENGKLVSIVDYKQKEVYIPTTFYNGEPMEQRNLLSIGYKEIYSLENPMRFAYTSPDLYFEVESESDLTCRLAGRGRCVDAKLFVPRTASISGIDYTVIAVGAGAFEKDTALRSLVLPSSVSRIGARAFAECTALKTAALPTGLQEMEAEALADCTTLSALYLHAGLKSAEADVLRGCTALKDIHIDGAEEELSEAARTILTEGAAIHYRSQYKERRLRLPLHEPTESISDFRIGDTSWPFSFVYEDDVIRALDITLSDYTETVGKEVVIHGEVFDERGYQSEAGTDFLFENQGKNSGGFTAILGCTVCESFDGRVFLSGNPDYPNTVFYSARDNTGRMNPTYFGSLNYFNDGIAGFPVKSLLAAGDSLAVFKSGDDGGGSIYYHVPQATDSPLLPKIYPVSYVHSGIAATAGSLSFFDDPVFVCEEGICALDKKNLSLQRSVTCRSQTVNTRLITEDMSRIRLAKWRNYLVVSAGEHIYLADAHQTYSHPTGSFSYEWYYLNGIGTYRDDEALYRFSGETRSGFFILPELRDQAVINETVYSIRDGEDTVYYILRNQRRIRVYPTEQRTGGTFSPAKSILGLEEFLFFGTESGDLCLFNNDKRGVAPDALRMSDDFNEADYRLHYGRRIHEDFYDFDHHAPRYALSTKRDCCEIPHLTKSTVKGSLAIKCRSYTSSALLLEVGTDRAGYREGVSLPGASFAFDTLDFSAATLDNSPYFTLSFREKEKNWIEKQIAMYSEGFREPFGIYSLSYRFTVQGRIKNR